MQIQVPSVRRQRGGEAGVQDRLGRTPCASSSARHILSRSRSATGTPPSRSLSLSFRPPASPCCLCGPPRSCSVRAVARSAANMSTEKERESYVYMAKLAEQAERYDGACFGFPLRSWLFFRVMGSQFRARSAASAVNRATGCDVIDVGVSL